MTKAREKKKAQKVTIFLTNRQLLNLRDGLRGLLRYEVDRNIAWNAHKTLEAIAGSVSAVEQLRRRILEKHAQQDDDGQPMRQVGKDGQVHYVVPAPRKVALSDEMDAFMEAKEEEGYTFPAGWRIPFKSIPKKMLGEWLQGIGPLVIAEDEEGQGGGDAA